MQTRLRKVLLSPRVLIIAALFALLASVTVAVTQFSTVNRLDAEVSTEAQAQMTRESADRAQWLTSLASTKVALVVTIVGALVLLLTRHRRGALALTLVYPVTQGVVHLVKVIVERPRPEISATLAEAHGFSFPSAHSATSVAVYATLAFVLMRASRSDHGRIVVGGLVAALLLAVGLSRVLLGAHYPSDVLAGWVLGALLASLCWLAATRIPLPRVSLSAAR